MPTKPKRATQAERDEAIVRKAGPWSTGGWWRVAPVGPIKVKDLEIALEAEFERILNGIARKGRK
jgi:hypothetical protein